MPFNGGGSGGGGGGSGTVTSVAVTTNNGVSGVVANATTTPNITLTLGIITPTAVAPSGLTGSVAASRYLGATTTGAPITGAHVAGDWIVSQSGNMHICTSAGTAGTWTSGFVGQFNFTPQTTTYAAIAGDFILADSTAGSFTSTLPTTPVAGTRVGIKWVAGANTVSLVCGGSSHFNTTSGGTALTIALLNQAATVIYNATTDVWVIAYSDFALSTLDSRYLATTAFLFSGIGSGTNTTAAMIVGTGASLAASGTGTITATACPGSGVTGTVSPVNGGTGVANNASSTLTISGSFATTVMISGTTTVTLPTTGTLAALGGANTWTGINTVSTAGASTASAVVFSGLPFAGTSTTATPLILIGSGSNAGIWDATALGGTYIGINSALNFAGNFIQFSANGGASLFKVAVSGAVTCATSMTINGVTTVSSVNASSRIKTSSAGATSSECFGASAVTPFSGGNGTNNFPQCFMSQAAAAVTNWSTSGTVYGSNPTAGFAGNFIDFHAGTNTSLMLVTGAGAMTLASSITTGAPTTGTAGAWKLGVAVTTTALAPSTTVYIQLDVGGTLYKMATYI